MQPIDISDPAWLMTFPHRVAPLSDEWLAGLLLRCDEANHWGSGTTLAHLRHLSGSTQPVLVPHLIVPTQLRLEYVAEWLALPESTLRATTYLSELTRCYGVSHPLPGDLRPSFSFRICPECLTQNRLLKRTLTLSHILYCPWHQITLLSTCQCGTPLRLFNQQASPFTCLTCGMDWADLPRLYPSSERLAVTQRLLSCYEVFLALGEPALVKGAFRLIYKAMEKEARRDWIQSPKKRSSSEHLPSNGMASLGPLVFYLVRYHLI